jgi:hypothetical protein
MSGKESIGVPSGEQVARPQPEVACAASLLEEIRGRIWFNTGCSDGAAENAAAAVYDLFLDREAIVSALQEALADLLSYHDVPGPVDAPLKPLMQAAFAALAQARGEQP